MIYGKAELKKNEEQALSKIKKLSLHYFDNLHAKCYFNEEEMIITSMNIYEYSEKNNREMGVLICRKDDAELFKNAVDETHSILKASKEKPLFKNKKDRAEQYNKTARRSGPQVHKEGVCIRCCTTIDYDPEKPYCYDCYKIWAEYENAEYQERVCHACEKPGPATMMRPLCPDCFKQKPKRPVVRLGW